MRWETASLWLLAIIFTIRFPVKFALESSYLMDFNVYRFAAELVRTGQGPQLYQLVHSPGMFFKYAPIWAFLWSPLAYLSTHEGLVLWCLLNVGWLILTLWLASRILTLVGFQPPWWTSIAAVLVLVRAFAQEFGNGQVNLCWGCLLTLSVYNDLRGRPWRAASMLALAILLKLPAALFLLYALLVGRWPLLRRTVVALAILLLVGAIGVSPSQPLPLLVDWMRCLFTTTPGVAFRIADQSLFALAARFLTSDGYHLNVVSLSRSLAIAVAFVVNLLLLCAIVLPARRHRREPMRLVFDSAMLMALMILASPAAWLASYSALVFPVFAAAALIAERNWWRQRDVTIPALALAAGLFSFFTHNKFWKAIGIPYWRGEGYVFLVFMMLPWFGLALLGLLWRQRQLALAGLGQLAA